MREFVVYTSARIGLFVASYLVIAGVYMLAARTHTVPLVWPFVVAAVVSAVASFYLLKGPRARFAARVDERATNATRRIEAMRAKEDDD